MSSQSITFSSDPTEEELLRNWTLSGSDKSQVRECRGVAQRYSFALQLCVLRQHGHFMAPDQEGIPLRIINHVGEQLGFAPTLFLPPIGREPTLRDHHRRLSTYLGFTAFDENERRALVRWLRKQVRHDLHRAELNSLAREFLLLRKTLIPADSTLTRIVGAEVTRAEKISFQKLAKILPTSLCRQLDALLVVEEESRISKLDWLTQYPPEASPSALLEYMERLDCLREVGMVDVDLHEIRPSMVTYCANLAARQDAYNLKRFSDEKRAALVFSLLLKTQQSLFDHVVEMHRTFLIGMKRRARRAVEQQERERHEAARQGLLMMLGAMKIILDEKLPMCDRAGRAHDDFGTATLLEAFDNCNERVKASESAHFDAMRSRHSYLKRYLPGFLRLPFEAEPGAECLLAAIVVARQLHQGEIAKLPDDVSADFTSSRWQAAIFDGPKVDTQLWEIALAFSVRDALRAGDLYLAGSQHHVSFWNLAYSPERWEREKSTAYQELRMSEESSEGVGALLRAHHEEASALADGFERNEFVRIKDGALSFRKQKAMDIPESLLQLRQVVQTRLPRIRIEELLTKVDSWCGFTKQLSPPEGYKTRGERPHRALMATLVAHGTNLGIATMAQSTKRLSVSMLHDASRLYLRPETIKAANRVLVDYHQSLPLSQVWGDGGKSSSDGQRFGVQKSSLLGSFYPRYFGYYDRALTVYTHISDQYSVFGTRVISCGPREAMHVLDGLIENDTVLGAREHFTDTHGATDQIFGLCHLLGYSFRPRLKDLKDQKLYRLSSDESYGENVDSLFSGTLDLRPLHQQWDQMIRLASSLANRTAPAHLILQKLVSNPRADGVAKALTTLGRIVKTTFLLRYMHDKEMRQRIRIQLNRGEHRHALARRLFFGNQGVFNTGDYEEIMNKASALSLLSNAVLVWNTVRIGRLTAKLGATDADLARVSPLAHGHVIPSGTYHFDAVPSPTR